MERVKLKVSVDRKYTIPNVYQERYGLKPGRFIVFGADDDGKVVGKVF